MYELYDQAVQIFNELAVRTEPIRTLIGIVISIIFGSVFALLVALYYPASRLLKRIGVTPGELSPDEKAALTTPLRKAAYLNNTVVNAILVVIVAGLLFELFKWILFVLGIAFVWMMGHWWFFFIPTTVGWVLYRVRDAHRTIYGVVEVAFGVAAIVSSMMAETSSDFIRLTSIAGGTYIIVRGLDNIDTGKVALRLLLPASLYSELRWAWEHYVKRAYAQEDKDIFIEAMLVEDQKFRADQRKLAIEEDRIRQLALAKRQGSEVAEPQLPPPIGAS